MPKPHCAESQPLLDGRYGATSGEGLLARGWVRPVRVVAIGTVPTVPTVPVEAQEGDVVLEVAAGGLEGSIGQRPDRLAEGARASWIATRR